MTRFCVNIAFLGAVCILATSLHHRMQNDWTSIQQVTAHWWLPRHSTLDLLANSVWSQPWLRTPPQHYKSSQWRAESGQPNKHASCHYFSLYGDTHPQSLIFVYYSWSRPMSVNKIQIFSGVCVCVTPAPSYQAWCLLSTVSTIACCTPTTVRKLTTATRCSTLTVSSISMWWNGPFQGRPLRACTYF